MLGLELRRLTWRMARELLGVDAEQAERTTASFLQVLKECPTGEHRERVIEHAIEHGVRREVAADFALRTATSVLLDKRHRPPIPPRKTIMHSLWSVNISRTSLGRE